ncbi:cytochrome c oxidase assembly protein [uncultured Jatrophihabitans sp.]|uniref:cytochrome c oxidase assembly protein n=1 Tax=uncultured Jatrophihabitans sp. TaxID=1610747 RepID=UPI0035C9F9E0
MTIPGTGRQRSPGRSSLALLVVGSVLLLATAAALMVGTVRDFAGVHGPVLPVSLCRTGVMRVLPPLTGARWFTAWQRDPIAITVVVGAGLLYLAGVSAVARRHRQAWPRRRTLSFAAGLAVCVIATCSPIATYDMAMFSAHMLGHLALVMIAPPLLVCGRPVTLALHATRNPWHTRIKCVWRSRAAALWFSPPVALASYAVVIVGTHLTGLMDVIMSRPWAGQLEHAAYLLVGYQFFALVLGDEPMRWRLSMPAKQLLLAVAMAIDTFTGVVLLQTATPITMTGMSPRHLDPLAQTRLGGAIMWVGGDGIMALVMVIVVVIWVRMPEHRRRESRGWLEQARRSQLDSHELVGAGARTATPAVRDVDDDERAHERYNAWLARLDRHAGR